MAYCLFCFQTARRKSSKLRTFFTAPAGARQKERRGKDAKKSFFVGVGIPVFSALSLKGNTGSTLAGAMPKRQGGRGGGAMPEYLKPAPDAEPRDASVSVVASVA